MGCDQSSTVTAPPRRSSLRLSSHYKIINENDVAYVKTGREKLKYEVKYDDDFLQHHLDNELPISPYATSHKIRARQLMEHYIFKDAIKSKHSGLLTPDKLTEFALKAWFQRTFSDLLEKAQKNYFEDDRPYLQVKQQLAEEYVFELYQMGSFINAGFGKYSSAEHHMQVPLSPILLSSDSALYFILQTLQQRYPLVSCREEEMTFPQVEQMKSDLNLLTLINSKSFADLDRYNYQSTMDDLKMLIDEANRLFGDFTTDMQHILGAGVETDCKVKWQQNQKDGELSYNASAVRRIFIKWSETLIERIPEVCNLKQFMDFVRSKKEMADQFIFKGTVTPTTHQQVLDKLSGLLESIKCETGTKIPRKGYGLFLYDLLRSKTTRKTGQEVVELLQKLKQTKITSTGKRFQVIRIKNRFNRDTRDLLVNFRYGEHLVAEVQLCVDSDHTSQKVLKEIKFRHMLYELERGLFGPTFEMIMQYEDYSRKDIVVKMQTEGEIKMRTIEAGAHQILKMAGRRCPQKHQMIAVVGDIFSEDRLPDFVDVGEEKQGTCDFCFQPFSITKQYHYCYYCSIFYCLKCLNSYKVTDRLKMKLSCLHPELIPAIDSPATLRHLAQTKNSIITVFVNPNSLTSQLFLDQIAYLLQSYLSHSKALPEIYKIQISNKEFSREMEDYQIERTPTTIIFDGDLKQQVTVVGCTYSDVEDWFQIRERVANRLPKGLKIKCLQCNQPMSEDDKGKEDSKCQSCMDAFKIEKISDFLSHINGLNSNFACKQGHVRCKYCSYLSKNSPSFFKDYTGRSYLSNKVFKSPLKCSRGHVMDLIPTQQSHSYLCYKCEKIITDQTQLGEVGVCFQCLQYLCLNCHTNEKITFLQRKAESMVHLIEIVSHFVQNKLEEGYPCGCGKYFWRVYQSQKINTKKIRFREIFGYGVVIWTCFVCKKEQSKLQLHLACFYCKYAESLKGRPSHTEICLSCAMKSGLIGRTISPKVKKQSTNFKCPSYHAIVRTSERNKESMSFQCFSCKKDFHPYTQRFLCQTCNLNFCLSCGGNLEDMDLLTTPRLCTKGHYLKPIHQSPKLAFCRLCCEYLEGSHFECQQKECSYLLCLDCSMGSKQA